MIRILVLAFLCATIGVLLGLMGSYAARSERFQNELRSAQEQQEETLRQLKSCKGKWDSLASTVINLPGRRGEIAYIPGDDTTLFPPPADFGPFPALVLSQEKFPISCVN